MPVKKNPHPSAASYKTTAEKSPRKNIFKKTIDFKRTAPIKKHSYQIPQAPKTKPYNQTNFLRIRNCVNYIVVYTFSSQKIPGNLANKKCSFAGTIPTLRT